jgi:acylphosphatase
MTDKKLQFQYRIYGQVQGVGFRAWLKDLAEELEMDGYCRNRSDGSVELVVSHVTEEELDRLDKKLKTGPPSARVDRIEKNKSQENITKGFAILTTR